MKKITWSKLHKEEEKEIHDHDKLLLLQPSRHNIFPKERMYVCCSNFKLTKSELYSVSLVEGVEGIQVVSNYRFIILIGEMFDVDIVKNSIYNLLCTTEPVQTETEISISKEQSKLVTEAKKYKYWLGYFFPNGNMSIVFSNELTEEYKKSENLMLEAYTLCGGVLINVP